MTAADNHELGEFDPFAHLPDADGVTVIAYRPSRNELATTAQSCLQRAKRTAGRPKNPTADDCIKAGDWGHVLNSLYVAPPHGDGIAVGTKRGDWIDDAVSHSREQSIVTDVIINNLLALGETHTDIRDRVERLVDDELRVHVLSSGFIIDEDSADVALGVLDELTDVAPELQREAARRDARRYIEERDPSVGGRPPLGFGFDDGNLVPADDFEEVRELLLRVDADDLPKSAAARRLDTSPRTITRCIEEEERREMYSLD
jgi:hypothetical protein